MTITPDDRVAANKAFDVAFAAQGTAEQIEDAMAEVVAAIREQAHAAGRAAERADVVAWLRTEAGRIDDLNRHVDTHLFADAIERGQHKEQKP